MLNTGLKKLPLKLIILVGVMVLLGCEQASERAELQEFINNAKKLTRNDLDELPEEKKSMIFTYDGLDKRSPFQSSEDFVRSQMHTMDGLNKPDIDRRKELLEKFDLRDLKMVGSLKSDDGTYWALIQDTNNMIYKVKPGNYLGKNFGKIKEVSAEGIEIEEVVSDTIGVWKTNNVIMKLTE